MRTSKLFLAAALIALAPACSDGGGDHHGTDAGTDAGADAGTAALTVVPPAATTTAAAEQAIALAPTWLAADLRTNLSALTPALQDSLAAVLIGFADPRGRDEIAFSMAHTSPEMIASSDFRPQVFADNVASLLEIDDYVGYADIVDTGDPAVGGDYWSTIRYRTAASGATEEIELDRDTYYWFIVHPVVEDEPALYIDPATGAQADPPTGRFWRDYLFFDADDTYQPLQSYLADQDVLWKGKAYDKDDNGAVGGIIQWVQDVMEFGSGAERPIQPVRIYALHLGRCGEHGDITTAAARAAMIPNVNVSAWANDHVWNEFYDQDWIQWEPVNTYVEHYYYYADANGDYYRSGVGVDNDCDGTVDEECAESDPSADADSDGYTVAAGDCNDANAAINPGVAEILDGGPSDGGLADDGIDNDCDGTADDGASTEDADSDGTSIAAGDCNDADATIHPGADEVTPSNNRAFAVSTWRGDNKVWTITDRYAGTFDLGVTVTDTDGLPVDGATVVIAGYSTTYPESPGIYIATWAVTDADGAASFVLGEANTYYGRVESPLGNSPAEDNTVTQLWDDQPVKGETRTWEPVIGASIGSREFALQGSGETGAWSLQVDYDFSAGFVSGANYFTALSMRDPAPGSVDVAIVDDENYALLEAGSAPAALYAEQGAASGSFTIGLPDDGPWNVVVLPSLSVSRSVHGTLSVAALREGAAETDVSTTTAILQGDDAAIRFDVQ